MPRSLALLLLTSLAVASALAQLPNLPDLDVTYIQRIPRNVGVGFNYPDDIPMPVCTCLSQPQPGRGPFTYHPGGGKWLGNPAAKDDPNKPLTEVGKMQESCQHWPKPGQTVTFIGHVINHGGAAAPPGPYVFLMDGKPIAKGELAELAPGQEATPSCEWKWRKGDHWVEFRLTPKSKEICDKNNSRKEMTTAIALTLKAASRAVYDAFNKTPNQTGSYSFEDWAQYHIDVWNDNLARAVYPITPKGVTERIRLDGVYPPDSPDITRRQSEGEFYTNWTFDWTLDDIPRYAKGVDNGLIHELCHQCGIIDLYTMGLTQVDNIARRDDGKFVNIGYYHNVGGLMGPGVPTRKGTFFSEHEAGAFQAMKGWPRWGYGIYLFDIPKQNVVRVLDNRGRPIAGAKVLLYQQGTDTQLGRIPPLNYAADPKGEIKLGDFPFAKLHVVGISAVLMLEIRAYGQVEYHCLDVTQMNLAYWRGKKDRATYEMRTAIAPDGAPAAPQRLEARLISEKKTRLAWKSDADPKAFLVLRSDSGMGCSLEPPLSRLVELPGSARDAEVDVLENGKPRFFAVTAVDRDGRQSACSNLVRVPDYELIPYLVRPWGVALGPDGTAYVIDHHLGLLMSIGKDGRPINWREHFLEQGGIALAVSPDGSELFIVIHRQPEIRVMDLARKQISRRLGGAELKEPSGVAVSKDGTVFVVDSVLEQVVIFDKDGRKIGAIEGFKSPSSVAFDGSRGLLCVADCGNDRLRVYSYENGKSDLVRTVDNCPSPRCVAFGPEGRIYVGTYGGGFGLTVLSPEGQVVGRWVQKPFSCHDGIAVFGVAVAPDGTVYLTQGGNERWFLKVRPEEIQWTTEN